MKVMKDITINLSEDEVKEIIADYITQNGYKATSKDVKLSVGERCEGYGCGEHLVHYFDGATVRIKTERGSE